MNCPFCSPQNDAHDIPHQVKKHGRFRRSSDCRSIQRFMCKRCDKSFSLALNDPAYNHKKRRVNYPIKTALASCMSQRRIALLMHVSRTTVARKLRYWGDLCRQQQRDFLEAHSQRITQLQFDELQTIEHSKCKPLSVAVAVSENDRKILGIEVSSMPATGHLAVISRKKYGKRPDHRREGLRQLFRQILSSVSPNLHISSDEHPYYKPIVDDLFPNAVYTQSKGEKAAITGQGELKKKHRDPLFSINHTLAMLRANINRLVRRTWCTTKKPQRLADHLAIYMNVHNTLLTA